MSAVHSELTARGLSSSLRAVGITNQRETTVVWDRETGQPLYDAVVWLDARTQETVDRILDDLAKEGKDKDELREKCGLPVSTYFSAVKVRTEKRGKFRFHL